MLRLIEKNNIFFSNSEFEKIVEFVIYNRNKVFLYNCNLSNILPAIFNQDMRKIIFELPASCAPGKTQLIIDQYGKIFPCEKMSGKKYIGNISNFFNNLDKNK